MNRFQIVIRSAPAVSSGAGRYRRPKHVRLVDTALSGGATKRAYRRNDPSIVREWRNVDSRYTGPRSAYGQALAEARELVELLGIAVRAY